LRLCGIDAVEATISATDSDTQNLGRMFNSKMISAITREQTNPKAIAIANSLSFLRRDEARKV